MKDQLFWVHEEVAKVDMWDKYESTSKEWIKLMTEAELNIPFMQVSQRDDAHYYYLFPLSNYADLDKMQGIFNSAVEKIGKDKWSKFMVENNSSMESSKDYVVTRSAKYSYVPGNPRTKQEEVKLHSLDVLHIQNGKPKRSNGCTFRMEKTLRRQKH